VFCATACIVDSEDLFRNFVSDCMTEAFGAPNQAVKSYHRDKVAANVEIICAKAQAEKEHLAFRDPGFRLRDGLVAIFLETPTLTSASFCLMVEVAIHHKSQLRASDDLGDLALAARLVNCLRSLKIPKRELAEFVEVDRIIQKLGKHAEGAFESCDWSVLDQCAEVATSLLSVSPEQAQAFLVQISMAKLERVMKWFEDQGLTTIGGVASHGSFAFGPRPGETASFDFEQHGDNAIELAEAWAALCSLDRWP
jgi:hypothetical protein